jgi:hypothetical protein
MNYSNAKEMSLAAFLPETGRTLSIAEYGVIAMQPRKILIAVK